jgi:hypothetical protein
MDYFENAARQARERAEAEQRDTKTSVQVLVDQLNITPELARYLLDLNSRITSLERNAPKRP